jgi:hypothetical protein
MWTRGREYRPDFRYGLRAVCVAESVREERPGILRFAKSIDGAPYSIVLSLMNRVGLFEFAYYFIVYVLLINCSFVAENT